MVAACGKDADKLWRNKKLEDRATSLLQPKTWFLKKHVDWPESAFRLMMLYKDACGTEPKEMSYAKVEGLDEALKPWRASSALAKWLRGECTRAYTPSERKKRPGPVANLAKADEDEDEYDGSTGEITFGTNLGTPNGYLQG